MFTNLFSSSVENKNIEEYLGIVVGISVRAKVGSDFRFNEKSCWWRGC